MITKIEDPRLKNRKCLILFSGGFDSTFVAVILKRLSNFVIPLCINYPNRPEVEKEYADRLIVRLGLENKIEVSLPLQDSRLDQSKWLSPRHEGWIAHRNVIFFGVAAHFAYLNNCDVVAAGTRVWDTTAYDDATLDYLTALEKLLQNSGSGQEKKSKIDFFLPIIESHDPIKKLLSVDPELIAILNDTWSCWRNVTKPCGECAPCVTREKFLSETKGTERITTNGDR